MFAGRVRAIDGWDRLRAASSGTSGIYKLRSDSVHIAMDWLGQLWEALESSGAIFCRVKLIDVVFVYSLSPVSQDDLAMPSLRMTQRRDKYVSFNNERT